MLATYKTNILSNFMQHHLEIYIDGACNINGGGWGVVVYEDKVNIKEMGGAAKETTNNQMELQAAIVALTYLDNQVVKRQTPITIYSDSQYVIKGITSWCKGWQKRDWQTSKGEDVLNQEYWQQILELLSKLKGKQICPEWQWVKGHSGNIGNDRADKIATSYAKGKQLAATTEPIKVENSFKIAPYQTLTTLALHQYWVTLSDLEAIVGEPVTQRWRNFEFIPVEGLESEKLYEVQNVSKY